MNMKKNIGIIDRLVRIVIALVIDVLYFANVITGTLAFVLLIFALILIVTGIFRFCPLYLPFGISTIRKKNQA